MFNIIELGSIGGGGSMPVLPDGWDGGWMLPPAYDATTINGKTDICGIVCNVLDIGDRNYFSCIAAGAYTVNVYTDATATTLISTQDVASGVQANWQIDYALCTHQLNTNTRQAYVEVVPQSGQSLTTVRFNTNHPAETNANSATNFVAVFGALPALTNATSMFYGCYALKSATFGALPALTSATSMFQYCYSLQSVTPPVLAALTSATSMFGTTAETTCLRSLRRLILNGLRVGFVLQYTAMQAPELNALFTSLGTANGTQTIDVRNNPGSATCDANIAVMKGYTVLTA